MIKHRADDHTIYTDDHTIYTVKTLMVIIYSPINSGFDELHMPSHASGVQLLPNMKYSWVLSKCKFHNYWQLRPRNIDKYTIDTNRYVYMYNNKIWNMVCIMYIVQWDWKFRNHGNALKW